MEHEVNIVTDRGKIISGFGGGGGFVLKTSYFSPLQEIGNGAYSIFFSLNKLLLLLYLRE